MMEKKLSKIKFYQIAEEWLQFKKNMIKESTYLNYKFIIQNRLVKKIGNLNLNELSDYNFNLYVEKLTNELAKKTVKDVISVLKSILKYAELKYDLNLKLSLISSPTVRRNEIQIFSEKEVKKIVNYCKESKDLKDLGFYISIYSGLRIGEICALKWKNIDFENKCINVTNTIQRVYVGKQETKIVYTTPKTFNSLRKIPLAISLGEKLKPISKCYSSEAFILTGDEEKWIEPISYRYTYRIMLKKYKIPYKKYHTLRHTFATRCIKVGMDVKSLSEVLGHANVTITLNTYVHSSFETKNKFINKL